MIKPSSWMGSQNKSGLRSRSRRKRSFGPGLSRNGSSPHALTLSTTELCHFYGHYQDVSVDISRGVVAGWTWRSDPKASAPVLQTRDETGPLVAQPSDSASAGRSVAAIRRIRRTEACNPQWPRFQCGMAGIKSALLVPWRGEPVSEFLDFHQGKIFRG